MYLNQLQGKVGRSDQKAVQITYRSLPASITVDLWGYGFFGMAKGGGRMCAAEQAVLCRCRRCPRRAQPVWRWQSAERRGAMASDTDGNDGEIGSRERHHGGRSHASEAGHGRAPEQPTAASPNRGPI